MVERGIVGGHVAFRRGGDGEDQPLVAFEQGFLQGRQHLVGVLVEARAVLLWLGTGNRLVAAIEQVVEADTPGLQVLLELRGDGSRAFARQVIGPLVIVVQAHFGKLLADRLGLADQLFGGIGQLPRLSLAALHVILQLQRGGRQAGQTLVIVGGAGADPRHLLLDLLGLVGDAVQPTAGGLDLLRRLLQFDALALDVLDHCRALLADVGDHLADFLGGAGGARRQVAHLIGDHGETTAHLAGASRLDGGVERQQVGLAGDGLDHLGDLLDLFGAATEAVDQLAAGQGLGTQLLHAADGLVEFGLAIGTGLTHMPGRRQCLLGTCRAVLLGKGNGLGGLADLLHRRQLRLQAFGQVLDRVGDPGCGQRVVTGVARQPTAQLDEVTGRRLAHHGGGFVAALPGPQPGPQRQQQEGRHADISGQLHLLIDQHQARKPDGVQQTGDRCADESSLHDRPQSSCSGARRGAVGGRSHGGFSPGISHATWAAGYGGGRPVDKSDDADRAR